MTTQNTQPKAGPTPGALRAAHQIINKAGLPIFRDTAEMFAAIIDRETAAPELLEALQRTLTDTLAVATQAEVAAKTFPNTPGFGDFVVIARYLRDCSEQAKAAIAKATA